MADLPDNHHGVERWEEVEGGLAELLQRLWDAPGAARLAHDPRPPRSPGVYLFVDCDHDGGTVPMYVGQTRNLRERLAHHCRASSGNGKASFAFNIARRKLDDEGVELVGFRNVVEQLPEFQEAFREAKERVDAMEVRFALSDDPELRTVLEVYAALRLGTLFNSFETH